MIYTYSMGSEYPDEYNTAYVIAIQRSDSSLWNKDASVSLSGVYVFTDGLENRECIFIDKGRLAKTFKDFYNY